MCVGWVAACPFDMLIPFAFLTHHQQLQTHLPVIPHTLFGGGEESSSWGAPRIWERHAYDTRFVSITTMNLNVPHNVFDSITGIEIEVRARMIGREKGEKSNSSLHPCVGDDTYRTNDTHSGSTALARARGGTGASPSCRGSRRRAWTRAGCWTGTTRSGSTGATGTTPACTSFGGLGNAVCACVVGLLIRQLVINMCVHPTTATASRT